METLNEKENSVNERWNRFMSGRSMWVSILVYTVLAGIAFGLVYLLMHILIVQWWVAVIVVVAIGATGGVSNHRSRSRESPDE
jgi:membrane protein required for beta-lactamase induction